MPTNHGQVRSVDIAQLGGQHAIDKPREVEDLKQISEGGSA